MLHTERRVVFWQSQPDALLCVKVIHKEKPTFRNLEAEITTNAERPAENNENGLVHVVLQIILKSFTYYSVLQRTTFGDLLGTEPEQLLENY